MSQSEHKFNLTFAERGAEDTLRHLNNIVRLADMANMNIRTFLLLLERAGLPPNVTAAISLLNTMITTVHAAHATWTAFKAMNPELWPLLIAGVAIGVGTYAYGQWEMERASREW